jgi:hypothetical protein
MACLEGQYELNGETIKEALRYATVMAAMNVAEFSVQGILDLKPETIEEYKENLCQMTI